MYLDLAFRFICITIKHFHAEVLSSWNGSLQKIDKFNGLFSSDRLFCDANANYVSQMKHAPG